MTEKIPLNFPPKRFPGRGKSSIWSKGIGTGKNRDIWMTRLGASIALLTVVALTGVSAARATADGAGLLSAYACGKLPIPLRVEVEAQDDSRKFMELKKVLIDALSARKTGIAANAPLKLSLFVETLRETERRKGRDLGQFSTGNRNDERTKFRMNLWSNRQDSVIGGRKDEVLSQAVDELYVGITVNDKANGRCVWQGEAKLNLDGRDEFATAQKMIPLLAKEMGRTIRSQPIFID